jgi:hypothetical protein
MKTRLRVILILLLLTSSQQASYSQPRLSVTAHGVSFDNFVKTVEAQSPYHFFFQNHLTDSLLITVDSKDVTIEELLNQVFYSTNLKFAVDQNQYVYITNHQPIITKLFLNFISDTTLALPVPQEDNIALASEENKTIYIGTRENSQQKTATITGYVRNEKTGEPLVGATLVVDKLKTGVVADVNGFFSFTIVKGRYSLRVRSIGMKAESLEILLRGDGKLNIDMAEEVLPLKEIIIEASRDEKIISLQMGLEKLDVKTLKQIPVALGEADLIKGVLTLPGVQSVGEATVGFNVRGGAADQNLILLDNAPIYNPSHLFGFFSSFNSDLIKTAELYKSGIPVEYGGRISSVLDIHSRDGNKRSFSAAGGISPVAGRLSFEGPLIKDKASFLIGGRSTYSNWLLKRIPSDLIKNSEASFYDANARLSFEINEKNYFETSTYISSDQFKLLGDTTYAYQNQLLSFRWRTILSKKLTGEVSTTYSNYQYTISDLDNPATSFDLAYEIRQAQAKADFNYFLNPQHGLGWGAGISQYKLASGSLLPVGNQSIIEEEIIQPEQAVEVIAYAGDNFELNPKLAIQAGVRYSYFFNYGPRNQFLYQDGIPRSIETITDTISIGRGNSIAQYSGPEFRIAARYSLPRNASVKISYNRTRQYIHMLSNTTAIAPTDIWKLSDAYIKPLIGDQFSIGYYKLNQSKSIEFSMEGYFKTMQNVLDFKGGAELILNQHIETDVVSAAGRAYGAELMIKKPGGKLNGWISYTYSRSLLQTKSSFDEEQINNGQFYPSNYDKPHGVNMIGNFRFNRRLSISVNAVYSTGRPITLPIAKYVVDGAPRLLYSDRNQYRIPDYFRTDLAFNIEGNHKLRKLAHSSWSLSVYNLTGRRNAYSIYFTSSGGFIKGQQLSIFGTAIPTITYNFRI